jgi:Uma2 family endonuclease
MTTFGFISSAFSRFVITEKRIRKRLLHLDEQTCPENEEEDEILLDSRVRLNKGGRMAYAAEKLPMTEDEYLAFERASDERHEFVNGEVFAMAGGTYEHTTIAANIIGELQFGLRGRRCTTQTSDMRIYIPTSGRYVYADASVVCGKPEFKDETHDTLLNPRVVVEVLSPSTEAYDRGEKFEQYQTVPSIMHYVLAEQDKPRIEVFTRMGDGSWNLRTYGPGDRLELSSIECVIDVDQVYTNVFDREYELPT